MKDRARRSNIYLFKVLEGNKKEKKNSDKSWLKNFSNFSQNNNLQI